MKHLLLASLFFLLPVTALAVPSNPEQFEKLENEFSLECKKYGAESCAARFISMAACTYVFAINQGKHPDEAMDISDKLFVGIMRGNKIKPEIMFTQERNIKPIKPCSPKLKFLNCRIWLFAIFPADKIKVKKKI